MVDVALLDVTLASMTNLAQYYLTSGYAPKRYGNAHATIVPYQSFETKDGHMVIAVGNDHQFARMAATMGAPEWATDPRFLHNDARVANRDILIPLMEKIIATQPSVHWVDLFQAAHIPAAAVNSIDKVFDLDQIQHRGMEISMDHEASGQKISLVGSPLHLSETPVTYRAAPPVMGQDTNDVLLSFLDMEPQDLAALRARKII